MQAMQLNKNPASFIPSFRPSTACQHLALRPVRLASLQTRIYAAAPQTEERIEVNITSSLEVWFPAIQLA
jgi:hypothetical protein